jgi:hypothetical protein
LSVEAEADQKFSFDPSHTFSLTAEYYCERERCGLRFKKSNLLPSQSKPNLPHSFFACRQPLSILAFIVIKAKKFSRPPLPEVWASARTFVVENLSFSDPK